MSFFENTRKPVGLGGKLMVAMMNLGHGPVARWGLRFLRLAPNAKVLDCGCGGGANIKRLLEKCPHGVLKRHIRRAALQNGATPLLNRNSVELSSLLHADGRIVDALDDAMRAFFQQPFYVRPAAAAAI